MPIRKIDFSKSEELKMHDDLVELVDKMLMLNKDLNKIGDKKTDERATIKEEIEKTDAKINELAFRIYEITESEKRIVEDSLK